MKILNLSDALKKRYALCDISVIYQTNMWSVCTHPSGRIYNGFLLFDSGEGSIEWSGGKIDITPGLLVYLPSGSRHRTSAKYHSLHFYRINFVMSDIADGEKIVFSDRPVAISYDAPKNLYSIAEGMCRDTLSESSSLKSLSAMAQILEYMNHIEKKSDKRRVADAISYIDDHYTEDISVSELAKMCFLSEAQLFRLFKREVGMPPVDYKNHLRIKKAQELLLGRECSIGEISTLVGFENPCYFSRCFKRITGMSAAEYRNKY